MRVWGGLGVYTYPNSRCASAPCTIHAPMCCDLMCALRFDAGLLVCCMQVCAGLSCVYHSARLTGHVAPSRRAAIDTAICVYNRPYSVSASSGSSDMCVSFHVEPWQWQDRAEAEFTVQTIGILLFAFSRVQVSNSTHTHARTHATRTNTRACIAPCVASRASRWS